VVVVVVVVVSGTVEVVVADRLSVLRVTIWLQADETMLSGYGIQSGILQPPPPRLSKPLGAVNWNVVVVEVVVDVDVVVTTSFTVVVAITSLVVVVVDAVAVMVVAPGLEIDVEVMVSVALTTEVVFVETLVVVAA